MHLTREVEQAVPDVTGGADAQDDTSNLIVLGIRADSLRRQLHPDGVMTYTNTIRISAAAGQHRLLQEQLLEATSRGATGAVIDFTSGTAALPPLPACESLVAGLRAQLPSLWLEAFTPAELFAVASQASLPLEAVISRLRDAGLDSICAEDDLVIHRAAHRAGMQTTATLPVLAQESVAERNRRLAAIRSLQEETGCFRALAVTAPPTRAAYLSDELTAVEYLTALACARLAVPAIPHIESSWRAQGLKLLQMTLRFGANDAGSTHLEQSITRPGPDTPTEEDLRHIIRDAGFTPIERSPDYSINQLP